MSLLEPLFEALNRADVRYVVVGGVAAVLHGHARLTMDVDLVVDLAAPEAGKAIDVLTSLGFVPRVPVGAAGGEVVGEVGLAPLRLRSGGRERTEVEVGWWTLPAHRGRGVASAAAVLIVDWARTELGLGRVVARIPRGHAASAAVATHAGLVRVGAVDPTRDLWVGAV